MLSTGIARSDLEMSDILQGQLHKIFVPRINVVPLLTIAYCILPPCLVKNVMHVNVTGSLCTHDPFFFSFCLLQDWAKGPSCVEKATLLGRDALQNQLIPFWLWNVWSV